METTQKHTPGPWRYQREQHAEMGRPSFYKYEVYTATGEYGHPATCDNEANARLIAAAPELLEALMGVVGWVECEITGKTYRCVSDATPDEYCEKCKLREKARAAIAKAGGAQ